MDFPIVNTVKWDSVNYVDVPVKIARVADRVLSLNMLGYPFSLSKPPGETILSILKDKKNESIEVRCQNDQFIGKTSDKNDTKVRCVGKCDLNTETTKALLQLVKNAGSD